MKLALHSVSYSGAWEGQCCLPLKRFVSKAAEFGYDGIELMAKRPHASPLDLDEKARNDLKEFIRSKNLEIACIAAYNDFADPSPYHREVELLYLRETIHLAHDLGAEIVRIFASGMKNMHSGASYTQQWNWVKEHIREAVKYAEDQGVILALQNHSPIMQSYKNVLAMVKEVDSENLKVTLDAPLLYISGESLPEAVRETGKLMVHSHTSDYIRRPGALEYSSGGFRRVETLETPPLGEGEIDYQTFVKLLREIDYQGFLSYEICSPIVGEGEETNLDSYAKNSLQYMRKLLAET